jgi:predicted AAA+ superfamily ATPase
MRARIIFDRISASKKNTLLLGPRQVGKSTLCRSLNPRRIIDLSDEEFFLIYAKDAGRLKSTS